MDEPSGLYDGAQESVWDVRIRYKVVPGMVSVRSDAMTTGEHYRYAEPYREAGDIDFKIKT